MRRTIASTTARSTATTPSWAITGLSAGATTLSYQVGHSGDDGYGTRVDSGSTAFNSNQTTARFGHDYDDEEIEVSNYYAFFRFTGVAIPAGKTITTAKLSLKFSGIGLNYSSHTFKIAARDHGDASRPTTIAEVRPGVSATYPYTSTVVDWGSIGSLSSDDWFDSPEIKTVIQEVIDGPAQGTWASGNALMLVVYDADDDESNKYSFIKTYDSASGDAAKLEITYS